MESAVVSGEGRTSSMFFTLSSAMGLEVFSV